MPRTLKVRPTEYKGVLYRSKCEAMFARYLELEAEVSASYGAFGGPFYKAHSLGSGAAGFVYEPEGLSVDGWTPDFLEWRVCNSQLLGCQIPYLGYRMIEYKPTKPTKTYAKEFATRVEAILLRLDDLGLFEFSRRCNAAIYYGSVFTNDRGLVLWEWDSVSWITEKDGGDWLANFEEEVKATRFDLEHGGQYENQSR